MKTAKPNARILIAEDNPQGVELLEAFLSDMPYEIRSARDGEATLKLVREWQPDLVLLDIMMPKLSGFEVCKQLRQDPATRDLPIIMVTALDQPSDVERAVEAGTSDFLTKPIHKTELRLRIEAMLASRRGQGELGQTIDYIQAVQKAKT
ncbi:MAG TPA: response regulator [Gemmataceae bacterium]|jgi:DNA-binding response OmpR family regulator|nr:response regulator [Gemmataceae bacterium]